MKNYPTENNKHLMETINASTLRDWLETGKQVNILDIRPLKERVEWFIPNSIYFDAYDKLKENKPDPFRGLYLDKTIPVVTICAAGKTSLIGARLLREQGFEAFSLKDGMKGWSLAWNTARIPFDDFEIIQFRRTGKGCLSYLLISLNEAILIDASLPIEVYQEILKNENIILKYVIETHIHADHLSRSKQVAEHYKVSLHLPIPNKVKYHFEPIVDTTEIQVGSILVTSIPTPGHTIESMSYLINDKVLLTGDTLFINGIGRPDLKSNPEEIMHKSKLLYQSLQKLLDLDENIIVLPAHTGQPIDFDHIPIQTTIGDIKKNLPILKLTEKEFIDSILPRIPPTPANYLSIIEKNITGDFSDINPMDLEAGANRCAIS